MILPKHHSRDPSRSSRSGDDSTGVPTVPPLAIPPPTGSDTAAQAPDTLQRVVGSRHSFVQSASPRKTPGHKAHAPRSAHRHTTHKPAYQTLLNEKRFSLQQGPWGVRFEITDAGDPETLAKACRECIADRDQLPQAFAFLDAALPLFMRSDYPNKKEMKVPRELLGLCAPHLLEHHPPPWPPGQFEGIREAIRCLVYARPPRLPPALTELIGALHPDAVATMRLRQLGQKIEALEREPNAPHDSAQWVGQLLDLMERVLGQGREDLALHVEALARRLSQLHHPFDQGASIDEAFRTLHRRWQHTRVGWSALNALFGAPDGAKPGALPLIQRQGTGASATFRVHRPTELAGQREQIVRVCRDWFQRGRATEALGLINSVVAAEPDPGFCHALFTALADGIVRHQQAALPFGNGHGIGQAMHALARQGGLRPKHPFSLEPALRDALLKLSDPESAAQAMRIEMALWFDGDQPFPLFKADVEHLLGRLEALFELARDDQQMNQLARWARQLNEAIGRRSRPWSARLKERCDGLCRRCSEALPTLFANQLAKQWALAMGVDAATGTPSILGVGYAPLRPEAIQAPRHPDDPITTDDRGHEQALFTQGIDRLQRLPQGLAWNALVRTIARASKPLDLKPKAVQWMRWNLTEAVLHHHPDPLGRLLQELHEEIQRLEAVANEAAHAERNLPPGQREAAQKKTHEAKQRAREARQRAKADWVHCLRERVAQGLPWSELKSLIDAVPEAKDWPLSAAEELELCLEEARHRHPSARAVPPDRAAALALLRRGRRILRPWVKVRRHDRAWTCAVALARIPNGYRKQKDFENVLFPWMRIELRMRSLDWRALLDIVDAIETSWHQHQYPQPIDRQRLLDLCIEHAQYTNKLTPLRDHLPKLADAPPSASELHALLQLLSQPQWRPDIRAALVQRLVGRPLGNDAALHAACVQAILAQAASVRAELFRRYHESQSPDQKGLDATQPLFDRLCQQAGLPPVALAEALRDIPRPGSDLPWPVWRALCHQLFARSAPPLSAPEAYWLPLLDTLVRLTPLEAFQGPSMTAQHLFDLLHDLAAAVPASHRLAFLGQLSVAGRQWQGTPALKAALQGSLLALTAWQSDPQPPLADGSGHDMATQLFAHGFLHQLALLNGDEAAQVKAHLDRYQELHQQSHIALQDPLAALMLAGPFGQQPPQ